MEKNVFNIKSESMIKLVFLLVSLGIMIYLGLTLATPAVFVIRNADVNRGEISLREGSDFDYAKDLFMMNGEWEFYPNQLLYSADFADGIPDGMVYRSYPHYWRDEPVYMPNGSGYATYRMVIAAPIEINGVGVFSKYQYGAYRVYLNGTLVCEGGNVSENIDEHYFAYNGSTGYIRPVSADSFEVIVHVQSYDHVDAGLANAIFLGFPNTIAHYSGYIKVITGMSIGAVTVLVLYFLAIFMRNRDKGEYLNFAIVSLCGLYLALTNLGENHAYHLVPEVSARVLYALEHIALSVGTYFASIHIIKRYIKLKHIEKVLTAFILLKCIIIAVISPYHVSALRTFIYATALAFAVAALVLSTMNTVKAIRTKEGNYSLLEGISILVLLCGAVLNNLGFLLLMSFDLFPVTVIFYCFMQIFVLAGYYQSIERNLIKATKALEFRAIERAADLAETNRRVEAAVSLKSEFLTRMTREMLLPMNAIISISELFDTENLSETQARYFRDIKETTHMLINFINDVMDFSRIETGRLELIPTHFNLSTFTENICSAARISARHKGIEFKSVTSRELPEVIYGDETRMKQVIVNIVSNAVKYTREGGVTLEVETTANPDGGCSLLFTVSDTGVGIRKENIPRMFDAFMNPDSTKDRGLKGTGLGLAICKRLMEMQKGRIEFDSKEGRGSVFKLYFPLVVGDKSLIKETGVSEKIYAKNAKILLVEDNTINVTVTLGILSTHDIRPDVAKDGYKALTMIREKEYDLVFMDQFLPGMDGVEITQRIREMGGKYTSLPIIAVTSNVVHGVRDMLIFKGMSDYLAKPIDPNELNNALSKWLPHNKITSALGRFAEEKDVDILSALPIELVAITEINFNEALNNMGSNIEIYMNLLRRLAYETDDYTDSLTEYLEIGDFLNYTTF